MSRKFKPALLVVDLQEDFCPPNGSLAVPQGRDIVPVVNKLLHDNFAYRVATKDWHPQGHISFASSHPAKEALFSEITIANPLNAEESYETRLWPDHCVQDTHGANIVSGIDVSRFDKIVEKGMRKDVEMYSAFYDPLNNPRVCDSGLAAELKEEGVTHVYVVGLAADYCVKCTAVDSAREGFETYIIEEGTRAVDAKGWGSIKQGLRQKGVTVVSMDGEEVSRVRNA